MSSMLIELDLYLEYSKIQQDLMVNLDGIYIFFKMTKM